MAAKLKSISKQIHWSLLLRTAVFALSWFLLPFWLFLLVALYLYFVPFFNARKLFWPFFALMTLAYIEPVGVVFLVIFAAIFYYLLLIKDLLLIDRKSAYELLILVLGFFLIRSFYETLGTTLITGWSIGYGLLTALLICCLIKSFIDCFSEKFASDPIRYPVVWFSFIVIWQLLILGLFLPLDFAYQSMTVFLLAVLVIDFLPEHVLISGGISRERMVTSGITIGILLFVVLLSAKWGI